MKNTQNTEKALQQTIKINMDGIREEAEKERILGASIQSLTNNVF